MRIYLLIFLGLLSSACKKDRQETLTNQRTILVYMGGDNNLYRETDEKIEALRKGFHKGMGRLLIYQDAVGIAPRLLEISADHRGAASTVLIKNYPEGNSASATVFSRVLNDVQEQAPAPSYGLILFSHASGWLPQRTLTRPYAIAQDGNEDLELRDFAAAIPDNFFDFMIFEACFMSGIEVMYQLKDKTDYVLASSAEILSPGFTPLYPELLSLLYKQQADLKGFARAFFNHYNNQEGDYRSATISVIRTEALPALAAWTKQYVTEELSSTVLTEVQRYDRYPNYSLFFDFEDYYQRVSSPASHTGLSNLLNEIVLYKAATPAFAPGYSGFEIKHFSGLTSYIPQYGFGFLNEEYTKLEWAKDAL